MKTITSSKPFEEILTFLDGCDSIYLVGCGTCATMCHTGGKNEVIDMMNKLEAAGKQVVGWMVIPTACDELTREALAESAKQLKDAKCILVMTCAYGVQTVAMYTDKPVYPALNTLFIGKEETAGNFKDICAQCGNCVLGVTAGICPITRCAKALMNGPCGGSVNGKCEVSPDTPCAWAEIIDRLTTLGQLDKLEEIQPIRDWSTSLSGGPRHKRVE